MESLQAVRNAHRARFVLVGSLIVIVCGAVALLALVPAYAIVRSGHAAIDDPLQTVSLPPSTDRDDVMRAQALVRELRPVASSTTSALQILGSVLSARPPGITISSMSFARGDPGTIVVSGVAPSRDEVNAYRAALSKDSRFKTVSVPIGILSIPEGGRFSVTLTGTF